MKFKIVRRSIQDQEIDHVLDLADMGFARKLIAKTVYGSDKNGEPTRGSLMRVHHILASWGIGVTSYRNGENDHGKAVIAAVRREADIIKAIRAAGKDVVATMTRKTG